jgi:cytosine/uracil/thiamine/allantoin permease
MEIQRAILWAIPFGTQTWLAGKILKLQLGDSQHGADYRRIMRIFWEII